MIAAERITPGLFGYTDRLDYRPGERVQLHLHGAGPVTIDLVRLNGADPRVSVRRPLEQAVDGVVLQQLEAGPQEAHPGSFGVVDGLRRLASAAEIAAALWLWPTRVGDGAAAQGILSTLDGACRSGWALVLAGDGRLEVQVGSPDGALTVARSAAPVTGRRWLRIELRLSAGTGSVQLSLTPLELSDPAQAPVSAGLPEAAVLASAGGRLLIAARQLGQDAAGRPFAIAGFNGKIEAPTLSAAPAGAPLAAVGCWDFSIGPGSDRITDRSIRGAHGRLHNAPTRAMTGHNWTGDEVDLRRAPDQYGAIHFHDDDLEDAGWPAAGSLALPPDLPSGIYAIRVVGEDAEDRLPVFVLPAEKRDAGPKVAFLAPTMTYQAYANASLGKRIDYKGNGLSGRDYVPGPRDAQLAASLVYAGSLYDVHSDDSGRCLSSLRRPIFNMRADYKSAVQQAPRHLGADLYITGWLAHRGIPFDLLTDHALDAAPDLLDGYRVLILASHPEYQSGRILTALEAFMAQGGRVMYLGANGSYWVTSIDPQRPHLIECRRGNAVSRTWSSGPGEDHHMTTGELGGGWRHRGRAPNRLLGIGMTSQGWDRKAPGFRRTAASYAPAVAWIFEGVADPVFGDQGLVMDGASGDELDRYDVELGSPPHATVVATSLPHSRFYKLVVEDVPMMIDQTGGDTNDKVRSDMVYVPLSNGGAVFSVGAISFAGALAFNDYENPVERILRNVLLRFLGETP